MKNVLMKLEAGLNMKSKSFAVLQAFVLVLAIIVAPAYAEHAGEGDAAQSTSPTRPEKSPSGSDGFYKLLSEISKGDALEIKTDFSDKTVKLSEKDLSGKFSKWMIAIEGMHSKAVESCKEEAGAKQLDELIRDYVATLSSDLSSASRSDSGFLSGVTSFLGGGSKVKVSDLYALTEAIREVLKAQAGKAGDKKDVVEKQNKELLAMLEKTNAFIAGADQEKLDARFKKDLEKSFSKVFAASSEGTVVSDNRTLKKVVEEAKSAVESADGKICEFSVAKAEPKKEKPLTDAEKDKKAADALAEKEAKQKKEEEAAAKAKETEKLAQDAAKRRSWENTPATGNKPGANGVAETGGKPGAPGAAAGVANSTPSVGQSPALDARYPDLNGNLGVNGQLGDILALKDQLQRDFDNYKQQDLLKDAALAQQFAQPQIPAFNSKSVAPTPATPPAPLPPIPPIAFGGSQGPAPYPPMPMPQPMPGPMPYMPPPPPIAPLPAVKTETTETVEEGYVPSTPMPMIQPWMPVQQPPTVINEVNAYVRVRLANGTETTVPVNQIPSGATVISSNNNFGNVPLTTNSTLGTNTTAGTSSLMNQVSSVGTSNRNGATSSITNSNSTVSGGRGGLTY